MNTLRTHAGSPESSKPAYEPPRITTYTSDEILEQVGPALTSSGDNGPGTLFRP